MGANADVVKAAWDAFGYQDLDRATADIDESAEIVLQDSLPWEGRTVVLTASCGW
jgi:hypothetical protein